MEGLNTCLLTAGIELLHFALLAHTAFTLSIKLSSTEFFQLIFALLPLCFSSYLIVEE